MVIDAHLTVKKSKRTTNPGIRIVGSRIYDSANGKTCHQCRQKTTDLVASCKNVKNEKPCNIKFCQKCLFNRYGEEVDQVELLSNWSCPKCRGKCNCSFCRKKQGLVPTGQLVKTVKASGFKSVDELLYNANSVSVSPTEEAAMEKVLASSDVSLLRPIASDKGLEIILFVEAKKEKSVDGNFGFKLDTLKKHKKTPDISKKRKRKGLTEISNDKSVPDLKNTSQKKSKICSKVPEEESKKNMKDATYHSHEDSEKKLKEDRNCEIVGGKVEEVPLPPGTILKDILDIEFVPEDIGSALQFLEFCKVFGKVLEFKKGEAEAILREMVRKKSSRRGENTLVVQFHTRMLSEILSDSGVDSPSLTTGNGKNSWLKALEDLITESHVLKQFQLDWLKEGISGYHNLDLSKKLSLLNFLCDEALGTEKLRSYMDEQNLVFAEEIKEAKSKVAAANEKVRCLKQTFQDEIAKAVLSNVPIAEHEAGLFQIKNETAKARAELLQAKGKILKSKQFSDAMRIDHVFLDDNGQIFWKLKCYTAKNAVLLQDIKVHDVDGTCTEEKWFVYDLEKKNEIDRYISSRTKVPKVHKVPYILSNESNAAIL